MLLRRKAISTETDEELVLAVRGGRQSALGLLWDRYAHLLLGVGIKYMKDNDGARDLVVDLFTALPELLRKHEVERFRPWIHAVMRNRCLLALRGQKRTDELDEALTDGSDGDDSLLHEQDLQRLEAAITQLNDAQRTCITLFHLERCCYNTTAERTGYTVEQVRSHLQNGRRNLRLILNRDADQNA